jgi:hypothetical protein
VNVLATFGAVAFVDRLGRRKLLIIASIWMFVTQVIVAGTLGAEFQKYGADLPRSVSIGMLVVSASPQTMSSLQSFPVRHCRTLLGPDLPRSVSTAMLLGSAEPMCTIMCPELTWELLAR